MKESWQKGFDAGRRQEPNLPPKNVEVLSWHSGYIEGQAERQINNESLDESVE